MIPRILEQLDRAWGFLDGPLLVILRRSASRRARSRWKALVEKRVPKGSRSIHGGQIEQRYRRQRTAGTTALTLSWLMPSPGAASRNWSLKNAKTGSRDETHSMACSGSRLVYRHH